MNATAPTMVDVVIIGGGVLGCSVAWHLARLGVTNVLLIERNSIGSAATSRAAALLTQARTKTCLIPLVRRTYRAIAELEEELGDSLDLHRVGTLHVAASPASLAEQQTLLEVSARHGILAGSLDPGELEGLAPWLNADAVESVAWWPEDGFLDPYRLATAYATAARRRGVLVNQGCAVYGVLRDGRRVIGVDTASGPVRAGVVIDAAGAWANLLAAEMGLGLPMAPVRSHTWITVSSPEFSPRQPIVVLPDAAAFARPELGGLLFGLRERRGVHVDPRRVPIQMDGFAFDDDPDGWNTLEEGAPALMRWVPALERIAIRGYVAGLSTYTPDGLFLLGGVTGLEGFLAATGCCGAGVAASGGIGQVVAELATEHPPTVDVTPFRIDRFGRVDPFDPAFRERCAAQRSGKRSG
jgi:4-methylaminobutanoate oxidase (formaldehyde-forming)